MGTYDVVFHFGDISRTVVDVVKGQYTYDMLLRHVHRLDPMPQHTQGMVAVTVEADVDDPPERIPVTNDDDMRHVFDRNQVLKELHLYIKVEVVYPISIAYAHEEIQDLSDESVDASEAGPEDKGDKTTGESGHGAKDESTNADPEEEMRKTGGASAAAAPEEEDAESDEDKHEDAGDDSDSEGVPSDEVLEDNDEQFGKHGRWESSSDGVAYSDEETACRYQNVSDDEAIDVEDVADDEDLPPEEDEAVDLDEDVDLHDLDGGERGEGAGTDPHDFDGGERGEGAGTADVGGDGSDGDKAEDSDFEPEAGEEGVVSADEDDVEDEEMTLDDVLLSKGGDLMSDLDSDNKSAGCRSETSDDEAETDGDADSYGGTAGPMRRFMSGEYYEPPEDHGKRVEWNTKDTCFEDVNTCRNAVNDFAIREGFILQKIKNDAVRVTMRCRADGCPWRFHASRLSDGVSFKLKTFTNRHTCCRTALNTASADWMSRKLMPTLKANPTAHASQLKEILHAMGIKCSYMQIWRARQKAMMKLDGDHTQAFVQLPYYCRVLQEHIQNSHIVLQYESGSDDEEDEAPEAPEGGNDIPRMPRFKRIFVGLAALRDGYLAGCSPMLGLDGCHLKGAFGGILLSAVGVDGDNGIYPLCWAVVEAETRDSWLFFLRNMEQFLGGFGVDKAWTVMTDRQKGLIQAVDEVIPHAINRKCAKHIFANLTKQYAAKKIKKHFWGAARSYTEVDFWCHMEKICIISPRAYDWLMKIEPSLWSRHAFDTRVKNDHVTNNFTESFNAWIGPVRHKPIVPLLDALRQNVMKRLQDRFLKAQEWTQPIMPHILKRININMTLARQCNISRSSPTLLEVSDSDGHCIVNLDDKSCDCRGWEVSGMPCKHACKAIEFMQLQDHMSDYVDKHFLRSEFLKTYGHSINPVPSADKWNYRAMEDVTPKELRPPALRRLPGRPRVNRRRDEDEGNVKRSSDRVTCGKCGERVHNKRTCQGGQVRSGRTRRKRRTFETSGSQALGLEDDEPLGSYVSRSQRRRTGATDAGDA